MSNRLTEHSTIYDLDNIAGSDGEPGRQDIGATNAQTDYKSVQNFARVMAWCVLGTWNSSDDLDECRLQQATSTAGGSVKDLTTDASGGNYDTDNPIDADGDFVIIEARSEDFDIDSLFNVVRFYCAEGGDSGTDNIAAVMVLYGYAYPKKELQGAASTGSQVYVDTGT